MSIPPKTDVHAIFNHVAGVVKIDENKACGLCSLCENEGMKQTQDSRQNYWIQEYNAPGENWIDYVGLPNRTFDEASREIGGTIKTFPNREFRLVIRIDAVVTGYGKFYR